MISFPEITQDVTDLQRHFNQNTLAGIRKNRWKKGKCDTQIGDRILTGSLHCSLSSWCSSDSDLKAIQFVVFSSLGFSLPGLLQLKYKSPWLTLYCWFPCTVMTLLCSKCWLGAKCLSLLAWGPELCLWLMISGQIRSGNKGVTGPAVSAGGRDRKYFGILQKWERVKDSYSLRLRRFQKTRILMKHKSKNDLTILFYSSPRNSLTL